MLPPTSAALLRDETRPYFLWWAQVTVGEFRRLIGDADREKRSYWVGALLREANTRDVWYFVRPRDVRELWPDLIRHLGRRREMWAFLLGLPASPWPPLEARHGKLQCH